MERLVGDRVLANLKERILPAGLRDVQKWTGVTLTFMRQDAETGQWRDIVTCPAISIRLGQQQPREAMGNVETTEQGQLKVWAADVAGANEIRPGDRFVWNDHTCVVVLSGPVRLDTHVTMTFRLLEG